MNNHKHLSSEERYLIIFLINNQKLSISEMAKNLVRVNLLFLEN